MTAISILTTKSLRRFPLPSLAGISGKDDRGRVLAVVGCRRVPGAGWLAGTAALRAGSGKVQLVTPRSLAAAVGLALPEAGIIPVAETPSGDGICPRGKTFQNLLEKADCILVGPGLLDRTQSQRFALTSLKYNSETTFVVDAGAILPAVLNSTHARNAARRLVITPHHGEMASLLKVDEAVVAKRPLECAREVANDVGCVVVLKSKNTYIVSPDDAWRYDGGSLGLATSGSGDVLAGMMAGLLARGAEPLAAALWSVYAHGKAGRQLARHIAPLGFLAHELLDRIPPAIYRT